MLGYDPALVHLERAVNPSPPEAGTIGNLPPQGGAAYAPIADIRVVAPTGWSGDLAGVTVETGRALLEQVAEAVVKQVKAAFGV